MPLITTTSSPSSLATWLQTTAIPTKPSFLIVYASLTNGRSWCGDCRDAEPFINKKFDGVEEEVRVVYAGERDEWRKGDNIWRQAPFEITALPTLVKVRSDGVFERLVEGDVYNQAKLDTFVSA